MKMHLLEIAQRSIHQFYDECTTAADDRLRQELQQLAARIARIRTTVQKAK